MSHASNNLILIGMSGVGKTTVGRKIADEINWPMIDTDGVIAGQLDKPLHQIVCDLGEEKFCDFESSTIRQLGCYDTIIVPGGSVIYRDEAMKHLADIGILIYLKADSKTIADRVATNPQRGIVWSGCQNLEQLWRLRHPLYEKHADMVINQDGMSVADWATAVIEEARRFGLKVSRLTAAD